MVEPELVVVVGSNSGKVKRSQTLFFSSPRPPLGPQAKISLAIAYLVLPCFNKYARRSLKLHKENFNAYWAFFQPASLVQRSLWEREFRIK